MSPTNDIWTLSKNCRTGKLVYQLDFIQPCEINYNDHLLLVGPAPRPRQEGLRRHSQHSLLQLGLFPNSGF